MPGFRYLPGVRGLAVPAPYGDGLEIGTGPISLWSGLVLIVIIAAVVVLYYRRRPEVQASPETVSVAAEYHQRTVPSLRQLAAC